MTHPRFLLSASSFRLRLPPSAFPFPVAGRMTPSSYLYPSHGPITHPPPSTPLGVAPLPFFLDL
ncbi:hypothetical protein M427DRAFT_50581 [Gonapodya prolifera JEL478]|uniref:Uncharacterized protein n=1 Tax=Gonapodya prolifera (strain JEL478) TaxID=1344416 RepID=A0A139B0M3_GONPJ|nr:hypothetical protein M427DRAFT_50581 [Gonapodya prolifera JEL478]|eukprot:KXS22245.1 hypothetical protein M427DRAFT_50581 [Gonapodya prolifera JEL478]